MRATLVRPFAHTKTAQFIDERIDQLRDVKSQRDIALELGFATPNILSMIKRGETKLPLDRVHALAVALDVDPLRLLRMTLEDYMPTLAVALDRIIGHIATENEWHGVLKSWREATRNSDPALTDGQIAALGRFLIGMQVAVTKTAPQ